MGGVHPCITWGLEVTGASRAQTGTWRVCGGFQASASNDFLYNVLQKEKRANSDIQPHVNASLSNCCCLDLAESWALKNPSPPNLYSVNAAFIKCITFEGKANNCHV